MFTTDYNKAQTIFSSLYIEQAFYYYFSSLVSGTLACSAYFSPSKKNAVSFDIVQ